MNNNIKTVNFETKSGNTLQVFFNKDSGLLVVDLIDKNDKGGNELIRKVLNEKSLLAHCKLLA